MHIKFIDPSLCPYQYLLVQVLLERESNWLAHLRLSLHQETFQTINYDCVVTGPELGPWRSPFQLAISARTEMF